MATSDPLQRLEEQLICPVCLELYKNPKGLPCQHSFCQNCLENSPIVTQGGNYFLKCPSCRKLAQFPDGGVLAFPPAFTINILLELHQETLAKQSTMECPQHKRPLEAFCGSCQELVCLVCIAHTHKKHDYNLISDIIHNRKQKLEEGLQPVKQQIATVTNAIKKIDTCDKALVNQGEVVKQQIHLQAQEAMTALNQAERKLAQGVMMAVQRKREVLALQKKEAQCELARLQNSVEYVEQSLKIHPDQQVVASEQQMLHHLKKLVSCATTLKFQPAEKNDLVYEKTANFADECSKLGVVRCSFLHQKCSLTLQPVKAPHRECQCQLLVRNINGSPLPIPTSLIFCQLTSSNGPQPADCIIRETGPGKYEISYTPLAGGPHQLRVMVGGRDIPGSEFSLVVPTSWHPETQDQPLQTIRSLKDCLKDLRGVAVSSPTSWYPEIQGWSQHPEIQGQPLQTIQGLKDPRGVAASSPTSWHPKIQGWSQHPKIKGQPLQTIQGLKDPRGVAVSRSGQVIISESQGHCITIFNSKMRRVMSVGSLGSGRYQFQHPEGVAVTSDDRILVADHDNNRVQVLTMQGKFLKFVGSRGKGPLQFNLPLGIAVHPNGQILVSEDTGNRIQVLNSDLTFSYMFGKDGDQQGNFTNPTDIAVDSQGALYVADSWNFRVQKFSISGQFLAEFVMQGCNSLQGIAIDDSDHIYVTQRHISRISVLTQDGKFVKYVKTMGKGNYELVQPHRLAIDQQGKMYVCDCDKDCITILV